MANATPLPNNASIAGNLLMVLLNGNNLWDVDGTAAARTEVQITAMLSDIVGYDRHKSGGFTIEVLKKEPCPLFLSIPFSPTV